MTVEELRRSYTKETGNTFYKVSFNTNLAFDYTKYSYQYVDWLEQKLTQPCSRCKELTEQVEMIMLLTKFNEDVDREQRRKI